MKPNFRRAGGQRGTQFAAHHHCRSTAPPLLCACHCCTLHEMMLSPRDLAAQAATLFFANDLRTRAIRPKLHNSLAAAARCSRRHCLHLSAIKIIEVPLPPAARSAASPLFLPAAVAGYAATLRIQPPPPLASSCRSKSRHSNFRAQVAQTIVFTSHAPEPHFQATFHPVGHFCVSISVIYFEHV